MTDQQRIEVLERQVKILSTFVHASMSLAPIQAAEFESQMQEAEYERCSCGGARGYCAEEPLPERNPEYSLLGRY